MRRQKTARQHAEQLQRQYERSQEAAAAVASAVEENSHNDPSLKSGNTNELQKLASSGRYARLWQPSSKRRAPKLNRRLY